MSRNVSQTCSHFHLDDCRARRQRPRPFSHFWRTHLGTSVILPQPLERHESIITAIQKFGRRRRVGEQVPHERRQRQRHCTHEEEDALIRSDPGMDMSDRVGEQGAKDGGATVGDLIGDRAV